MKLFKSVLFSTIISTTTLFSTTTFANELRFVASDNKLETKICVYAANNQMSHYRRAVKDFMSVPFERNVQRIIVNKLKCNGKSIVNFSKDFLAMDTVNYMRQFSDNNTHTKQELAKSKITNQLNSTSEKHNLPTTIVVSGKI
ncbi:hypothetical protein [Aliikangiella maris]|uniref:DUF3718 domain-containing protein n=2 Tax=Aliikangiella maris TaxID=3162458 RepID=A0ABV3MUK0_9GAMM